MFKKVIVHAYFPEATCDLSGKTAEAIEISLEDGSIRNAVVCLPEFQKLLRFHHRQQEKAAAGAKTPSLPVSRNSQTTSPD